MIKHALSFTISSSTPKSAMLNLCHTHVMRALYMYMRLITFNHFRTASLMEVHVSLRMMAAQEKKNWLKTRNRREGERERVRKIIQHQDKTVLLFHHLRLFEFTLFIVIAVVVVKGWLIWVRLVFIIPAAANLFCLFCIEGVLKKVCKRSERKDR